MVYFTADMHFGHRAIINMQNRPFESVEEMDRVLLQSFNSLLFCELNDASSSTLFSVKTGAVA